MPNSQLQFVCVQLGQWHKMLSRVASTCLVYWPRDCLILCEEAVGGPVANSTLCRKLIYGPSSASSSASAPFYFRALLPMFAIVWPADNGHYKFIRQSKGPLSALPCTALHNVSDAVAVYLYLSDAFGRKMAQRLANNANNKQKRMSALWLTFVFPVSLSLSACCFCF